MLKDYLRIGFRRHMRRKWGSLVDIFSLAIGIACCLLIFVYVSDELSYDRFHENADSIYRITYQTIDGEGEVHRKALLPHQFVRELESDYPAVKRAAPFKTSRALFEHGNTRFHERLAMADASFLSMFSFPLLVGNPERALTNSNNILVSPRVAAKFFSDVNGDYAQTVGKTLSGYGWRGRKDYLITGILKPVPKTSSLQFDVLMLHEDNDVYGGSNNSYGELSVYAQLHDGQRRDRFEASLRPLISKLFGMTIERFRERGDLRDSDDCFQLEVQPLADVYYDMDAGNAYESSSSIANTYILTGIGLLILALACINFITLSIGQSLSRTTEIGIRKVLGATRPQIIVQHTVEKVVLILISILLGYLFAELLLPTFNQLARKDLTISVFQGYGMPLLLLSLLVVSSFFAAGIPSVILSSFKPTDVFRAVSRLGGRGRISAILVIAQLSLSVFLLGCTFIISQQISFMHSKDLGYDRSNVVVIPISFSQCEVYKDRILRHPEITSATGCDRNFSNGSSSLTFLDRRGKPIDTRMIRVDEDYAKTLGLAILQGRNFSKAFPSDSRNSVIVNETLVREFGLKEPLGTTLSGGQSGEQQPTIIGVVRDYHIDPMHHEMMPLMLHMTSRITGPWSVLVKVRAERVQRSIEILRDVWKKTVPNRSFDYSFLGDDLAKFYEAEGRWRKITGFSSLFAFIICSLGLFGLASITAASRTKEIAVRKVLGASITRIVTTLTSDTAKWVVVANLVAWPAIWYAMSTWLEDYAYRITIEWWIFPVLGFAALFMALTIVSYHAIRAAAADPVDALKYE